MTKMLNLRLSSAHTLAPTTTATRVYRMPYASRVMADCLPFGLYGSPSLNDILLTLHIAEEEGQYLQAGDQSRPAAWKNLLPST